jgi:indole-3-glycerol phosphate synthase
MADTVRPTLSASIRQRQREGRYPVISEVKARSDKAGDLLRGRDPAAFALEMARAPVAGISVVTEPTHFGGHMAMLRAVADAVALPVLHKDFITTEQQVEASAAHGASALLLITSMLPVERLARLIDAARACGLETLVEAHTLAEVRRIAHLPFDLMGINNRDITIFEVDDTDVSKTESLAAYCGEGRILISESAISSPEAARRAGRSGADAVLVGTAVLTAADPRAFLEQLTAVGWPA